VPGAEQLDLQVLRKSIEQLEAEKALSAARHAKIQELELKILQMAEKDAKMAPSGTAEDFAAEFEGALHIQEQEAIITEVLPRAATPCASPEPRAEPSSARALPVVPWLTADVECAWPRRLRRVWSFGARGAERSARSSARPSWTSWTPIASPSRLKCTRMLPNTPRVR